MHICEALAFWKVWCKARSGVQKMSKRHSLLTGVHILSGGERETCLVHKGVLILPSVGLGKDEWCLSGRDCIQAKESLS